MFSSDYIYMFVQGDKLSIAKSIYSQVLILDFCKVINFFIKSPMQKDSILSLWHLEFSRKQSTSVKWFGSLNTCQQVSANKSVGLWGKQLSKRHSNVSWVYVKKDKIAPHEDLIFRRAGSCLNPCVLIAWQVLHSNFGFFKEDFLIQKNIPSTGSA